MSNVQTSWIAVATVSMQNTTVLVNVARTVLTVAIATDKMIFEQGSSNDIAAEEAVIRLPATLDEFLAGVERRAFRMAELALGHREDAMDVVQETMIKLLQYRDKPASEWSPLFWSILRRQLTDKHRRNAVKKRVMQFFGKTDEHDEDPIEALPDHNEDPLRRLTDDNSWNALGKAVRALPARQRECFLLRELQGLSVLETAAAMGCSDGSVKTHLSRALSALRIQLEDWQ